MAMLYGIRLDIYLRKSTERIHSFNFNGSHISSVFAIMWKSQSIHRNCLSALITLHSYRSLPLSAKPSYIISGAAEQLLSSTKSVMLNDEGRMPTPFRFFYVFGLAKDIPCTFSHFNYPELELCCWPFVPLCSGICQYVGVKWRLAFLHCGLRSCWLKPWVTTKFVWAGILFVLPSKAAIILSSKK